MRRKSRSSEEDKWRRGGVGGGIRSVGAGGRRTGNEWEGLRRKKSKSWRRRRLEEKGE